MSGGGESGPRRIPEIGPTRFHCMPRARAFSRGCGRESDWRNTPASQDRRPFQESVEHGNKTGMGAMLNSWADVFNLSNRGGGRADGRSGQTSGLG